MATVRAYYTKSGIGYVIRHLHWVGPSYFITNWNSSWIYVKHLDTVVFDIKTLFISRSTLFNSIIIKVYQIEKVLRTLYLCIETRSALDGQTLNLYKADIASETFNSFFFWGTDNGLYFQRSNKIESHIDRYIFIIVNYPIARPLDPLWRT